MNPVVVAALYKFVGLPDYHALRDELKAELKKAGFDIGQPPMAVPARYKKPFQVHGR